MCPAAHAGRPHGRSTGRFQCPAWLFHRFDGMPVCYRIRTLIRQATLSLPEAEEYVRREMEEEFERSESRRQEEARSASELRSTAM